VPRQAASVHKRSLLIGRADLIRAVNRPLICKEPFDDSKSTLVRCCSGFLESDVLEVMPLLFQVRVHARLTVETTRSKMISAANSFPVDVYSVVNVPSPFKV
jgi:hypothetical protein